MIRYFQENLKLSIRIQLNTQGRALNSWEEAVEKTVDVKAKTLLQLPIGTQKIDSRCFRENRPAKKKEKDFEKAKSTDTLSVNQH